MSPPVATPPLRYVQIQTTSRCNADCVFCPYVESWHAAHPGVMSDHLWHKILGDLQPFAAGLSRGMVAPYLMNEPLLDPRLEQRIHDITDAFPRTMVQVATNASALSPRRTERLLAALDGHKHQIWVSHHGIDAASFSDIMRLDHERTLRNLLHLLREAAGRFRILIRGAGQPRHAGPTWFTAEQYRAWWEGVFQEHGVDTRRVHVDAFRYHDRAGGLRRRERGSAALSVGRQRVIDAAHPFWCSRLDQWLHVLWDGRLRLCCMDYHGAVPLPSLADMTVQEYLASDRYAALVARMRGENTEPHDFLCEHCTSPGG